MSILSGAAMHHTLPVVCERCTLVIASCTSVSTNSVGTDRLQINVISPNTLFFWQLVIVTLFLAYESRGYILILVHYVTVVNFSILF
jgi:hypothetical protein